MKKLILLLIAIWFIAQIGYAQFYAAYSLSDYYDISNWTQVPGSGSIDISGAPNNISFISGNSSFADNTYIEIAAPGAGVVSLSWSYTTNDWGPQYDYPFYIINGVKTTFSSFSLFGSKTQSGTETFSVYSGDVFGFGAYTTDGGFGVCTINTFSFSLPTAPIALTSILSVFGLAGIAVFFRQRKGRVLA